MRKRDKGEIRDRQGGREGQEDRGKEEKKENR